jgi:hypothetical protein
MILDFVEFAEKLTIMVNTGFDSSGGQSDLAGAEHGGSALEGVGFAADGEGIGAAHDGDADAGVLEEGGDDLAEPGGGHGAQETVEDSWVDDAIGVVGGRGERDWEGMLLCERGAQSFEGQRLGEHAVEAVDGGRRCGGHGKEPRAGGSVAQLPGQLGSGEAGHAEIGEDAVGLLRGIGEEVKRFAAARGLQDGPAIGFEENGGDGKTDGVVVDGEDTALRGWAPGIHGVSDCTGRRRRHSACRPAGATTTSPRQLQAGREPRAGVGHPAPGSVIYAAPHSRVSGVEWAAMSPNDSGGIEREIAELRARVSRLENTLASRGILLKSEVGALSAAQDAAAEKIGTASLRPMGAAVVPTVTSPTEHETVAAAPAAGSAPAREWPVPRFAAVEAEHAQDENSLESRIGSQWFNRIGILAILIGVAWFLKLAFDNHWIGPLGRVLIGLLAGTGLIAWSERFRSHGYQAFSYSLKAVGSGVLYLSLWAAFSLYHLIGSPVAFGAMVAVTAFNAFLAWHQDAELLAVYAIVGGFSTPLLIATGENHEIALFCYLLLLDLAVLMLVALKPWSRLLCGALAGTVFFFVEWSFEFYTTNQFGTTAFFLACFFLVFAFAPRLVRLRSGEDQALSAWDHLAVTVAPLVNAGLGFLGFYLLLETAGSQWAQPWLAVEFAAFYLALLRLPQRGVLRARSATLTALHLTIAVVFLTIAIPLKAHGRWLTIGWLAEGGALMWQATRTGARLLRVLAVLCLALGLSALVMVNPPARLTPFLNERFGTYLVAIGICAFVAWLAARAREEAGWALEWPTLAGVSVVLVNALILLAVGWEIHSYWWYLNYRGDWHLMHNYGMYAQFTYSAFFMLFGAALLGIGFWRRSAFLRWQALVLLAVSIGKVFTVDLSTLSQGYRILSFLGLGALLLAVSFAYQKDWLNLRNAEKKTT